MNTTWDGVQQVLVTLDENQEKIDTFISYLSSNRPEFAEVSEIRSEDYGGDVVPIGTYLQDLQFEPLCKGIPAIIRIEESQHEMIQLQKTMLDKQDKMLEKQDKMLHKQDQMIHIQQDTVEELKGFRKDSAHYLENEFSDIKKKL